MADEQVIETLRIDIKLDKNFNINDLKEISASLKSFSKDTKSLPKDVGKSTSAIADLSKINLSSVLSSVTRFYHMAVKVGKTVQNIAQSGMDYNETLNLWTLAMRGHNKEATEFLKKMNDAYGVSEQTLMNAQATFKNMIGSLGQISSKSAYIISEGITQMALDYASLYNVSIESAITKFQAALAGQVRPIRTGTGLDITENTLFQFYQELGGEKTVRQLNRTEKQLLAILAVYKQMEASGAIGDMKNTIDYAANQSRVMAETWADIKDYVGLIIVDFLEANDILIKINAGLMVVADVLKAFAEGMGAIKEQTTDNSWGDALGDIAGDAGEANEEIKKLKSTLFGFDKFQVLGDASGGLEDVLDLDNKIIEEFKKYKGISEGFKMEARNLADEWLEAMGVLKDANGNIDTSTESWNKLKDQINDTVGIIITFSEALLSLLAINAIGKLATSIIAMAKAGKLLNNVLLFGIIFAIFEMIKAFKEGDIATGILSVAIGTTLLAAFVALNLQGILPAFKSLATFMSTLLVNATVATGSATLGIISLTAAFVGLSAAVVGTFALIANWSDMSWGQRIAAIAGIATTAILGLALAFGVFHSAWSIGIATAGIIAGIAAMVGAFSTIPQAQNMSVPSQTTAYTNSNQLEASITRGTAVGMSTMSDSGGTPIDIDVSIDGQNLFQIFRGVAQRNGYDVVKVR